jgi:hypothetical protein
MTWILREDPHIFRAQSLKIFSENYFLQKLKHISLNVDCSFLKKTERTMPVFKLSISKILTENVNKCEIYTWY